MISSVEKYYSPETKLEAKLTNEQFQYFLKLNPNFLAISKKSAANKSIQDVSQGALSHHSNPAAEEHEDEDAKRKREEKELREAHEKWRKQVIS